MIKHGSVNSRPSSILTLTEITTNQPTGNRPTDGNEVTLPLKNAIIINTLNQGRLQDFSQGGQDF